MHRPRLALALAGAALLALPVTATAADLPTQPTGDVRVSVTTPSGWVVEERGPKDPEDQRTTQIAVRAPGGAVDALLYPEGEIDDFCDPTSDGFHCLPLRAIFQGPQKFGTDGLLVADENGDGVPEIAISMFSGGAHCCITTVGWSRAAAGGWKSALTNGGSAGGDVSDARGRVRVANAGFEGMSWSYAATQPFYTWERLVPGRGWVDVTTKPEHRSRVKAMNAVVRRFARVRDAGEAVQAARAVRIGHRHALGQTARERAERRDYRRVYGRADARALTGVLRTVRRAR